MAIERAQVIGIDGLAAWLNTNATAFFDSVTYSNSELTATDTDGNTVFSMGNYISSYLGLRAYRASADYITSGAMTNVTTIDVIMCDNGIIIDFYYNWNGDRRFGLLITKTNNDKLAVIFSTGADDTTTTNYLCKQLNHVAYGDSTTMSTTTTFTPESGQQTIMCAFGTNADITDVSYTPKAFYMPIHSSYSSGIGKFLCGGKVYITNGYWCIDTEEDEE